MTTSSFLDPNDMNGDSSLLLVQDIIRHLKPWTTILDYAFYAGVAYGLIKCMQLTREVFSGFRTYFLSSNRIVGSTNFREVYGKWAGEQTNQVNEPLSRISNLLTVVTGATSAVGVAFAYEVRIA